MRISDDTPSQLRLRDRTLWLSVVCFGAALVLVGGAVYDREPRLLISAGFFVVFALASLRATDVTFDKIERTCSIRRLDILRVSRMRLAFDDIVDVKVEIEPMPDNAAVPSCRLSLVTGSATVPLTASYQSDYERSNAMRDAVLAAIMGDRPRPAAADPVRTLAKEGRTIDAVAILRAREGIDLKTASARVKELQKAPDA